MTQWQYYPKADKIPEHLLEIINVFEEKGEYICSDTNTLASNDVLKIVEAQLCEIGYAVEKSKRKEDKINVPVLFGRNGSLEKYFEADALNLENRTVIEVEAGRGVTNYQFLKDLFQACMMQEVEYLVIAVRNIYRGQKDFETVILFLDTLYASNRLQLPLKGILIIGY